VTMPSILVFAGLGSLCCHRSRSDARLLLVLATFVCGGLVLWMRFLLPSLSPLFLGVGLPVRVAIVVLTIAPLAFWMGFPFPLALRRLADLPSGSVPWAWAVNGCASVVASIVAILIAMESGFQAVLTAGALCYFLGTLSCLAGESGRGRRAGTAPAHGGGGGTR
jgi:hypothetical protein